MHPFRRAGFQIAEKIGRRPLAPERDEQVDVVGRSAGREEFAPPIAHDAADVLKQALAPIGLDHLRAVFGRDDDMDV